MFDLIEEPILEQAAREFVDLAAMPPFFDELAPAEGRRDLEALQPPRDDSWQQEVSVRNISVVMPSGSPVSFRLVVPVGVEGLLPIVLYIHGGTWVLGSARTHERLVCDIAVGADVAVAFPEYDRAPEAVYPTALEQCWSVAEWLMNNGQELGVDTDKMIVAGDCVGGNLAASLARLSVQRKGVTFLAQVLLYPVTDTHFDSASYSQFAEGYYVRRASMIWGFGNYTTPEHLDDALVAPLHTPISELRNLPPAFVLTAEADVVRDEGEAYAARLREAGVQVTAVRYSGTIHHFMMLDALRDSNATTAAVAQTVSYVSSTVRPRRRPPRTSPDRPQNTDLPSPSSGKTPHTGASTADDGGIR